ncbi:MAG: hypothetical protein WC471_00965 [Candidatus Woesearchaeota archaeon]|jgi:hypothetical protein
MEGIHKLCRQTPLYDKLFMTIQQKEIEEHEYFIRAKFVVKYEREITGLTLLGVMNHWTQFGYAEHFRERFDEHYLEYVLDTCYKTCNFKCHGMKRPDKADSGCTLSIEQIHKFLEDGPDMPHSEKRELLSDLSELEILVGKKP